MFEQAVIMLGEISFLSPLGLKELSASEHLPKALPLGWPLL